MLNDVDFKNRIMHHDCKLSNVLFHTITNEAITPIDLDTLMGGYFFSDLGDMIRSMVSGKGESESLKEISIDGKIYEALVGGYLVGMGDAFTKKEHKHIHHSGLIMIYMQALRFLSDYLLGDVYYKTAYKKENLDRAQNQLKLLESLEQFLEKTYRYEIT